MSDQEKLDILCRYTQAVRDVATKGSWTAIEVAAQLLNEFDPRYRARLLERYAEAVARSAVADDPASYEELERTTFEFLVAFLGRSPTDSEMLTLLFIGSDE